MKRRKKNQGRVFISNKINAEILKLLAIQQGFQQEVKSAREFFKIPADGFKTNEEVSTWYHMIAETKVDKKLLLNEWQKAIERIQKHYGLHAGFKNCIEGFIRRNDFGLIPNNWSIERTDNNPLETRIVIYGAILDREQDYIMKVAKQIAAQTDYTKKLFRKFKPYRQIDRDIEIWKLSLKKIKATGLDMEFKNDKEIAARIFLVDNDKLSNKQITKHEVKKAKILTKARERLIKKSKAYFPDDTIAPQ